MRLREPDEAWARTTDEVAEKKIGPDRWIGRTINIGQELTHPNIKGKATQQKKIKRIEDAQLANPNNDQVMLKNVFHKGYWKYKPEHFQDAQNNVKKKYERPSLSSVKQAFEKEMRDAQDVVYEKTALELKYEGTGRFEFSHEQLANYEE